MNQLQAAARDKAAKSWKMKKVGYRIGSVFKACFHCGSMDVWRSYRPNDVKWTYWCYFCGAKDYDAWENASDIGEFSKAGTRSPISKGQVIRDIEAQIAELRAKLAQME